MFKELSAETRQVLGNLLDGFEAALESQDPETIERFREALQEFLTYHDPDGDDPTGNEG